MELTIVIVVASLLILATLVLGLCALAACGFLIWQWQKTLADAAVRQCDREDKHGRQVLQMLDKALANAFPDYAPKAESHVPVAPVVAMPVYERVDDISDMGGF